MLSDPHATTAGIARAIGFSSATTLCHAFARVGWVSPQALQAKIARNEL